MTSLNVALLTRCRHRNELSKLRQTFFVFVFGGLFPNIGAAVQVLIYLLMEPGEATQSLRDELTWIQMGEPSFRQKAKSKGLSVYLVPVGCAATVGVLAAGLYNLYKRDSLKQQMCMRYRVLAQGITVAIAMFAMFQVRKEDALESKQT